MGDHTIRAGLDIPILGMPGTEIVDKPTRSVAVVAVDYVGMRPRMLTQPGDVVKRGQPLFEDKKSPGTLFTAPGAGAVVAVNRGARRALQSVVIDLNEREISGALQDDDYHPLPSFSGKAPSALDRDEARTLLTESGLWTALRTRPFSKTPFLNSTPHSIFVNACDTNPLAPPMDIIFDNRQADLDAGIELISKLTDGTVYFCKMRDSLLAPDAAKGQLSVETFSGPHPSGTVGLHIHRLDPVGPHKTVWHIGLQDLLTVGALALTGRLDERRIVALCGPQVKKPRLLRTRLGASLAALTADELLEGENRFISGSVLNGRIATQDVLSYLGRFHNQVSVLREGREREFMGWLAPGSDKFSLSRLFLSRLNPMKKFAMHTGTNGSPRAIVPIGLYEQVMPLDILPTFLLRALASEDMEQAEKLGCLELDEEDLALCSFVDPGKTDFGAFLRRNLELIEKEG